MVGIQSHPDGAQESGSVQGGHAAIRPGPGGDGLLVAGARVWLRENVNRQAIDPAQGDERGHIENAARERPLDRADLAPVHPDLGEVVDPVEIQPDPLAGEGGRRGEGSAIPVSGATKTVRDRPVILAIERLRIHAVIDQAGQNRAGHRCPVPAGRFEVGPGNRLAPCRHLGRILQLPPTCQPARLGRFLARRGLGHGKTNHPNQQPGHSSHRCCRRRPGRQRAAHEPGSIIEICRHKQSAGKAAHPRAKSDGAPRLPNQPLAILCHHRRVPGWYQGGLLDLPSTGRPDPRPPCAKDLALCWLGWLHWLYWENCRSKAPNGPTDQKTTRPLPRSPRSTGPHDHPLLPGIEQGRGATRVPASIRARPYLSGGAPSRKCLNTRLSVSEP